MKEEIKIIDGTFKKDDPHQDIGKQKFRVRRAYTAWVEYDVIADSKEEAEDAVIEHGGIERIEWQEGYHKDDPVEVHASDWNSDHSVDIEQPTEKVAECVPYEDWDYDTDQNFDNYEDPEWTSDEYRWTKTGDEPKQHSEDKTYENEKTTEIPF
jgi:hypothetical protein|tara:strand:- start:606 stop:1067 length:462 start_codon:yes stop_codon:yes gene_type:complete